ncbi:cell wall hydrolase [Sphingomonas sp.]|uniref:cell wall hydrolase n=1 Tax=Sphingomonas sp. TaxID=28214 RepID=UPI003CC59F61
MTFLPRAAALLAMLLGLSSPAWASDVPATAVPAFTVTLPQPALPVTAAPAAHAFASLAEAVAAQDGLAEDEHLRCLAGAVYFESQGQPLAGQLAVAQVILNRIRSGRFASTICGVVLQPHQFGFVRSGAIPPIPAGRAAYRVAVAVAKLAMSGGWAPVIGNALSFNGIHGPHVGGRRIAVIGGQAFYQ